MKNLTLRTVAEICGGNLYCNEARKADADIEVTAVEIDSRKIMQGGLFIATRGGRADGHDFISQVMKAGAAGVVCEKSPACAEEPYILVKDTFQALKDIAEFYRRQLSVKVVGITGSVGKTSTKEFIASVLSEKYCVLKTEGNFNNEVGLPLTILRIRQEHEVAVLEMGISDFGEMHRLSKMARPDICVLTNIGQCHLENLKTREGILQAKTEIFDFMAEDGLVCINGDDDQLRSVTHVKGKETISFGFAEGNLFYADQVESLGLFGSSALIHKADETLRVEIPLPGRHMIYNALAATAVGSLMGLTGAEISDGIKKTAAVSGRSNLIKIPGGIIIDDCYNANPASMKAAIDLLATSRTEKTALLGDMFELGDEEEKLHWEVGSYAVKSGIDQLICIGKLSLQMYEGAVNEARVMGNEDIRISYFPNKEEMYHVKSRILRNTGTILVKASHGMNFSHVVSWLEDSFK